MGKLSAKLRSIRRQHGTGIAFWCPGCDGPHVVTTEAPEGARPCWQWNGNADAPTLSPSILVTYDGKDAPPERCHSFVRAGRIEFLGDCTHSLAGQTVPLPDFPEDYNTG